MNSLNKFSETGTIILLNGASSSGKTSISYIESPKAVLSAFHSMKNELG